MGFYSNLDPVDFEIVETAGGVCGKKTRGTMAFLIPWERLKEELANRVEDAGE